MDPSLANQRVRQFLERVLDVPACTAAFALGLPVVPAPPAISEVVQITVERRFEPVASLEALLLPHGLARNRPVGDPELAHAETIQIRISELVFLIQETASAMPVPDHVKRIPEANRKLQPVLFGERAKRLDRRGTALAAPTGKGRMGEGTDVVIGDALKPGVQEKEQVGVVRMRLAKRRDELADVARKVGWIERHLLHVELAKPGVPPLVRRTLSARAGLAGAALMMASACAPMGEGGTSASPESPGVGAEISGHGGVQLGSGLQAGGVMQRLVEPPVV